MNILLFCVHSATCYISIIYIFSIPIKIHCSIVSTCCNIYPSTCCNSYPITGFTSYPSTCDTPYPSTCGTIYPSTVVPQPSHLPNFLVSFNSSLDKREYPTLKPSTIFVLSAILGYVLSVDPSVECSSFPTNASTCCIT